MSAVDLSIIIVSWNVRGHLERCLAALPDAVTTAHRWEVIVVDNASSDGSAEHVQQQIDQARVIANPTNHLYTSAANQGLDIAQGRHLLLLNPDTVPQPTSLARLIDYAESHTDVGLVGPRILRDDGRDDLLTGRHYPTLWSEFIDWMGLSHRFPSNRFSNLRPNYDRGITASVPLLSGACLLLPEHLPHDLRRLDAAYPMYGEDLDLSRRIQAAGFKTVLLAEAVVTHLGAQSSQQVKAEAALLAIDAANRYFRQWHGPGTARKHRLLMAGIALIKSVAFTFIYATGRQPDAAQKRRFYTTLLRWALSGGSNGPLTPTLNSSISS